MSLRILCLAFALAMLAACAAQKGAPVEPKVATPLASCPRFELASTGLPIGNEWRTHPSVGDINQDGLDDFAAVARKTGGPQVFLSDGLGGWQEASEGLAYPAGFSCGVGTRLVDLDEDGFLDLIVADHCAGLRVYLGDGGTSWTEVRDGIPRNLEGFNDAAVGDLDGNSTLDIVAVSAFTRGFLVLDGHPNGRFTMRHNTGLPPTGSAWQLLLDDVNSDGRLDVLSTFTPVSTDHRYGEISPAKVWLQAADGTFRPAAGFNAEGRYFGLVAFERSDRGTPDLIFALSGYHAGLYTWESRTGEEWALAKRIDESWFEHPNRGFSAVSLADLDADGCLDLLGAEGSFGRMLVAMGDCSGGWQLCPDDTLPIDGREGFGWGAATGDFNGDGRRDVADGYGTDGGSLIAWVQSAGSGSKSAQGQGPDASSAIPAADSAP